MSTFMTTDPLSIAIYTFKQFRMSAHLDIVGTFSVHPASPALLTSKGPRNALTYSSLQTHPLSSVGKGGDKEEGTLVKALLLDLSGIATPAVLEVSVLSGNPRTFGV